MFVWRRHGLRIEQLELKLRIRIGFRIGQLELGQLWIREWHDDDVVTEPFCSCRHRRAGTNDR